MGIINFSIKNPLVVNLFLVLIIVLGVISWRSMPQEMFPVVEIDKVRISTEFEGAPPEEVESQVTIPIEEELDLLADIDVVTSESNEGISKIIIDLKPDADVDEFVRDLRATVEAITDLPEESERPNITRLKTRFPVISLSVYGDASMGTLVQAAKDIKSRLQQIDGVASVSIAGEREWELWIEVDPFAMSARNVSLPVVISALRNNLRDLPGGSLKASEGDILLRGKGAAPDIDATKKIVLRSNSNGGQLVLSEIAGVQLRLEETKTLGRFNNKPSVNLTITKTAKASTIEVSRLTRELAATLQEELPAGIKVGLFSDLSIYVKTRLETLKSSGAVGLVLVLLSLYLFLNFRVAAITAMGIPVSFLVAVIIIYYLGYTINMVSMFAFLIALGMIVDDAIIVTENTYRHLEDGMDAVQAAKTGANEVFWPVMASTCTTIAAFLPMFGVSGTLGLFIQVIPVVVTASLLGSLFEAFVVLPSHSAEMLRLAKQKKRNRIDWQKWLDKYIVVVKYALRNRYFISAVTIAVLSVVLAYAKTHMPYNQFGDVEIGQFLVNVEAPNTYSIEDTTELAKEIEKRMGSVFQENELDTLLTNVGVTLIDFNRLKLGSNYIQFVVDLKKPQPKGFVEKFVSPLVNMRFTAQGVRERSTEDILSEVRASVATIPGIQRFSILRPQGGPAGSDIEVGIVGKETEKLLSLSGEVVTFLRRVPGVRDVRQDLEPGKLEYQYTINARGRELGLTQSQIADAVRTGYLGLEVMQVNWEAGRYPVRVIYPDSIREDGAGLNRLPITLESGGTVYLGEVAKIELGRGLGAVQRRDSKRLSLITAEVNKDATTPLEVTALLEEEFKTLSDDHFGYSLLFLGEKKEAQDSFNDIGKMLVIALAIIFFILAALFKSLLDPFVIMFAIPFAIVGVIAGHALFGYNLQFLSMIGFLALTGIVVNDSLILIDFAKKKIAEGADCFDALVEAGRVRIRPILLTTVTTFLGISPLIFFASGQTAFLSPMAVSLGFGLIFATVLILIVLPCFYMIADDLRNYTFAKFRSMKESPA
ncbi:MAG: efflux RND transporter permease subunit [Gammaproteobacteria bacterium]